MGLDTKCSKVAQVFFILLVTFFTGILSTINAEIVELDGRLGIGTANPSSPLTVISPRNRTVSFVFSDSNLTNGSFTWGSLGTNHGEQWRIVGKEVGEAGDATVLSFWGKTQRDVLAMTQEGMVSTSKLRVGQFRPDINYGDVTSANLDVVSVTEPTKISVRHIADMSYNQESNIDYIHGQSVVSRLASFWKNGAFYGLKFYTRSSSGIKEEGLNATPNLTLDGNGSSAFGGDVVLAYKLSVYGDTKIHGDLLASDILIEQNAWADDVFEPGYKLMSLRDLDTYVKQNKHLPGIPSETDVLENGVRQSELNAQYLRKIEELTLYIIELEKRLSALESKSR